MDPRKSQKAGQEDQVTFRQRGGLPSSSSWLAFWILPFKGPYKALQGPYEALPLKGLIRPFKGLIRAL